MSSKSNHDQVASLNSSQNREQIVNQKFKERGFIAWINMRLTPFDMHLTNILEEILAATNLKYLMQSITGVKDDKFVTLDNLKPDVFQNRLKWCVKELEKNNVIPENVDIGVPLLAAHNPKAIFDFLWRLICHDIYFLWDRIGYLSSKKIDVLIKVPFTWVPIKPPKVKNKNRETSSTDLMSSMGAPSAMGAASAMSIASEVEGKDGELGEEDEKVKIIKKQNAKFPGFDIIHSYNKHNLSALEAPDPKACVIDMINMQLKSAAKEGTKRIRFRTLNQLSDTRILCTIINSFVPNFFPTEILVNDRWCLNLILRAIDKIIMCDSAIDSEDLVEADPQSICAFFCYLFMMLYKLKQSQSVVEKLKILEENISKIKKTLEIADIDLSYKTTLETKLHELNFDLQNLEDKYDIKFYSKWNERVNLVKKEVQSAILDKLDTKFDWFTLDRDITLSNICLDQAVNLSLTNGAGFYKITETELISPYDRKIILKERGENPKFFYNFTKPYRIINQILKLPVRNSSEINPDNYPNLEIFVECQSNNKTLRAGTEFLYQVLPSDIGFYHSYLIKACQDRNLEAVKRLVGFFSTFKEDFINLKEKGTLNTALHTAAQNGYFLIIHFLLDNFADVNCKNKNEDTPLFLAADSNFKECVKLLLEYGADVNTKNKKKLNIIEYVKNDDLRKFIEGYIDRHKITVPSLLKGEKHAIGQVIQDQKNKNLKLCSIRNRFINGTTLLHLACKFDHIDIVERLLNTVDTDNSLLDPNIRDNKGRSPLHITHNPNIIRMLISYGAQIESRDLEGNTPLHVMCFKGNLDAIKVILTYDTDLVSLNFQKYLPVHSAAVKGHTEAVRALFEVDKEKKIHENLENSSKDKEVSSTVYLAIKNDFQSCAEWFVENGVGFKDGEADDILHKLLTDQIQVEKKIEMITFLCQNGCNLQTRYQGGNTALHYASLTSGDIAPIEVLIKFGAFVNVINDEMMSPLFNAVISNNPEATALLVKNNADYKIRNNDGQTAFDLVKEIDEWVKCDCFDAQMKGILKSYEYKQTRNLIRKVTEKVKPDFSMKAKLFRRKRQFSTYVNSHREGMSSYSTSIMLLPKLKNHQSQLTQSLESIY